MFTLIESTERGIAYTRLRDEVTVLVCGAPRTRNLSLIVAWKNVPTFPAFKLTISQIFTLLHKIRDPYEYGLVLVIWYLDRPNKLNFCGSLCKLLPFYVLLVLISCDGLPVKGNLHILRDECIKCRIEVRGLNGLVNCSNVLLCPLGQRKKDDVRCHEVRNLLEETFVNP